MKTKEEILNTELATVNMDSAIEITCASLRAMQLYSDQQNKELREKVAKYDEMHRLVGLHPRIEHWTDEIQRLTKENDDLRDNASEYIKELTRLRELLVRSIDFIDRSKTLGVWDEAKQLLTDIANALNHKP